MSGLNHVLIVWSAVILTIRFRGNDSMRFFNAPMDVVWQREIFSTICHISRSTSMIDRGLSLPSCFVVYSEFRN